MATFTDTAERNWTVELDGLLLGEVQSETGIDLGDAAGTAYAKIEDSPILLVQVLAVLCREQIREQKLTESQFSKGIRRDVLGRAAEAVLEAAEGFFPPSTWSELQSSLKSLRSFNRQWAKLRPMLAKLNEPEMPPALRDAVMGALTEMMEGIASDKLEKLASASGPAAPPTSAASGSPENAESAPAD